MTTKTDEIKEMMLNIPQKIIAYDGNPAGQHLYGEQRQQIAEALYKAGYRKIDEFVEKLKKNVHNYYPSIDSYCCSHHVVLVKDIDELLKEYK